MVLPDKTSNKKVDELKQILKTHVLPSGGILRKQRTSKSITHYVAALKLLAVEGELGNFLRDIFCIGIADVETQKKLLADKMPRFAEARETLSRATQGFAASPASHARAAPLFLYTGHNRRGRFHSCSKGGLNNRGRYSLPKQSAAITGARKCHRCGRVSLAGAATSIIFVATKVLQRGPPSKELQIQELRVQKLQKKGTLTSCVQKQRCYTKRRKRNGREKKEEDGDTCSEIGSTKDLPQQKQGPKRHGTLDSNNRSQQRPLRNGDANMTSNLSLIHI